MAYLGAIDLVVSKTVSILTIKRLPASSLTTPDINVTTTTVTTFLTPSVANATVKLDNTTGGSTIVKTIPVRPTYNTTSANVSVTTVVDTILSGGSLLTTGNYSIISVGGPAVTWSTNAGSLGSFLTNTVVAVSVAATTNTGGNISYSVQSGSLPTNLILNSGTGVITGTINNSISTSTVYTFTIRATENISSAFADRVFTITESVRDSAFNNVALLINGESPSINSQNLNNIFRDDSGMIYNLNPQRFGNVTQGSFGPFGTVNNTGWSTLFTRSASDGLQISGTNVFNFNAYTAVNSTATGVADFTCEAWIYLNSLPTSNVWVGNTTAFFVIAGQGTPSTADGFDLMIGSINLCVQINDVQYNSSGAHNFVTNTWYHVAYVRQNGTLYFYINGAANGSVAFAVNTGAGSTTYIGSETGQTAFFDGYISNLRVVKNQALYTGAFTTPTGPLTTTSVGTTGANVASSITGYVSLLALQRRIFTDSGSNNFTITVGTGAPKTFPLSPFPHASYYTTTASGASGYFTGTAGDYVTVPGYERLINWNAPSYWSLEYWVYPLSYAVTGTAPSVVGNMSADGTTVYWSFGPFTGGIVRFYYWNGAAQNVSTTATVPLGTWSHIAVVKTGVTINIYINGVLSGSAAVAGTPQYSTAFPLLIGQSSATFNGYIYNLRIINSINNSFAVGVYPPQFTVSTTPLGFPTQTLAGSGTQLLTAQSATLVDNSPNAYTLVDGFAPFAGTGSYAFNGTTQTLNLANPATHAFGTNNFTIEMWIYVTSWANTPIIIDYRPSGTQGLYPTLYSTTTGQIRYFTSSADRIVTNMTVPLQTWTHIALVRNSSVTRIYINGIPDGNTYADTNSYLVGTNRPVLFSSAFSSANYVPGAISNLRVVNGTAVYTGNFTPPSSALAATQAGNILTAPFSGTYSYSYNGTNQYLTLADNAAFQFGTGDFTIEWFQLQLSLTGAQCIYDKGYQSAGGISIQAAATTGLISIFSGSATPIFSETGTVVINNWYHIAVTRQSGTLRFFRNGVQIGSNTSFSTNLTGTVIEAIGAALTSGTGTSPGNYFNGYISNFRLIKGSALYVSNFTQPSTALSNTVSTIPYITASTYYGSFNGSTQYLTISNPAVPSSGQFTIEAWVYTSVSAIQIIYSQYLNTNANRMHFTIDNYTGYKLTFAHGTAATVIGATVVPLNQWNHVAVTRDASNTLRLFLNGNVDATQTSYTVSLGQDNPRISGFNGAGTYNFNGNISNVRVLSTALYTSNFTPSGPLTNVANTTLLTLQSATIIDNSSNNYTITNNGTVTTTFAPYGVASLLTAQSATIVDNSTNAFAITNNNSVIAQAYSSGANISSITGTQTVLLTAQSATVVDNSTYAYAITNTGGVTGSSGNAANISNTITPLDNTYSYQLTAGKIVSLPYNNNFNLVDDFTIDFWLYFTAHDSNGGVMSFGDAWQIIWNAATNALRFEALAATVTLNTTLTIATSTWTHIAITRFGNTLRFYINGTSDTAAAVTSAASFTAATGGRLPSLCIGAERLLGLWTTGYISNLRITNRKSLYLQNFAVPTTATPSLSNTNGTYLLTAQSATVVDNSLTPNLNLIQSGFGITNSAIPFANTYSYTFNGVNQNVLVPGSVALDLSGDFTIELWFNTSFIGATGSSVAFLLSRGAVSGVTYSSYQLVAVNGAIYFAASSANTSYDIGAEGTPVGLIGYFNQNTWNHVAVTRSGNIYRGFLNGIQGYTQTLALTPYSVGTTRGLAIGAIYNTSWNSTSLVSLFTGYISNVRIIKGQALYTANFTPPTTALTSIVNTVLLTAQSAYIQDNGPYSFTLLGTGYTFQNSIIPYSNTVAMGLNNNTNFIGNLPQAIASSHFALEFWMYPLSFTNSTNPGIFDTRTSVSDAAGFGVYLSSTNLILKIGATANNMLTTGSAATPFANTYSYTFNGTSQYLTLADNAAFQFGATGLNGAGDFTIEWFQYQTSLTGAQCIYDKGYQSAGGISIQAATTTGLISIYSGSATPIFTETGTVTVNTWYHIAITRQANTLKFFRGGTQIGSNTTFSTNLNGTVTEAIGAALTSGTGTSPGNYFAGYISNFRILKGAAAYIANFTPPTVNLNNVYNNNAIGLLGTTYSVAFNGTSQNVSGTRPTSFGTGNWQIECWINANSFNNVTFPGLWDTRTSGSDTTGVALYFNGPFGPNYFVLRVGGTNYSGLHGMTTGSWYHVATVCSSQTITVYVNGSAKITQSVTNNFTNTAIYIGSTFDNYRFTGSISNFRILTGSTTYGPNYSPPTTGVTAIANTTLLTLNSATIVDNSGNGIVLTSTGSPTITYQPYASSSLLTLQSATIVDNSTNAFAITNNNAVSLTPNTAQLALNTWSHVGIIKSGGNIIATLNGVNKTSIADTSSFTNTKFFIGSTFDPFYFQGYLNNVRLVIGTPYVSSQFYGTSVVVPSTQLTTVTTGGSTTALLTAQSTTIVDNGYRTATITNTGNVLSTNSIAPFSNTGSYNFNGTSAYINAINNPINFSSNPFTIEAFVYVNSFSNSPYLVDFRGTGQNGLYPTISFNTTGKVIYFTNSATQITSNTSVSTGTWTHIAVVKSSGTTSIYINGVADANTYSDSNTYLVAGTSTITLSSVTYSGTTVTVNTTAAHNLSSGYSVTLAGLTATTNPPNGTYRITVTSTTQFTYVVNTAPTGTISIASATLTVQNRPSIGVNGNTLGNYLNGYISNLRITNNLAIYTGTFTTPTTSLALYQSSGTNISAITGTNTSGYAVTFKGTSTGTQATDTFGYTSWTNAVACTNSGRFTIEFFIKFNSINANGTPILNNSAGGGNLFFSFDPIGFYIGLAGYRLDATYSYTWQTNTWYHIVIMSGNGNTYIAVNGVLQTYNTIGGGGGYTANGSWFGAGSGIWFGAGNGNGGIYAYGGSNTGTFDFLVSNMRWVTGSLVYPTTNFTPPTSTLTAIAGTSFLTFTGANLVDSSTYNVTITAATPNGTTATIPAMVLLSSGGNFSSTPVALLAANSTSTTVIDATNNLLFSNNVLALGTFIPFNGTYSYVFNGTSQYLSVTNDTSFVFGTGDFTIEFFVYLTAQTASAVLVSASSGTASSSNWVVTQGSTNVNNIRVGISDGTTITFYESTASLSTNTWIHVAVSRSSGTLRIYANGANVYSNTVSTNMSAAPTSGVFIMADSAGANLSQGYLSNLRVVKGYSLYNTNFTFSTQLTAAPSTVSLLTAQSNSLVDNSTYALSVTNSGVTTSNFYVPFSNTYSWTLNGTSYAYFSSPSLFAHSTFDFTLEAWVYPTSYVSTANGTAIFGTTNGAQTGYYVWIAGDGSTINLTSNSGGTWVNNLTANAHVILNTWTHIAVTRQGSTINIWRNGISVANAATFVTNNFTAPNGQFYIGYFNDGTTTKNFNGYISNVRITKGMALYTGTFPLPTTAFTTTSNTNIVAPVANNFYNPSTALTNNTMFLMAQSATYLDQGPYSTLLLPSNTTPGVINSVIPYAATYSFDFGGAASTFYMSIPPNAGFDFAHTNATVEFWIFPKFFNATSGTFISVGNGFTTLTWSLTGNINGALTFAGPVTITTANNAFNYNTWSHIAIAKLGGVYTIFINGVSRAAGYSTSTPANQGKYLYAGYAYSAGSLYQTCLISNIRVVAGNPVNVYYQSFTPPTSNLTAVAGTTFLLANNNFFNPVSVHGYGVELTEYVNSNRLSTASNVITPFANTYSWSFNSPAYWTWPGLVVGTNQYTFELWFYNTGNSWSIPLIGNINLSTNAWNIRLNTQTVIQVDMQNTSNSQFTVPTMLQNTWYHLAIVRDGNNLTTVFLNGVRSSTGTVSMTNNYTGTTASIAGNYSGLYTGGICISNLRLVIGSTVYDPTQTTLTVPTAPLTAITGTQLLTCQDQFPYDNSSNNAVVTMVNSAAYPTNIRTPFANTYSVFFQGASTSWYTTPAKPFFNIGNSDYTIECWVYIIPGKINSILSLGTPSSVLWWTFEVYANGSIYHGIGTGGWAFAYSWQTAAGVVPNNTWTHIAAVRSGSTLNLYVNGVSRFTTTSYVGVPGSSGTLYIGTYFNNVNADGSYFYGFISNLRIVNGTAVYTGNFTPSTTPLTAIANTVLLHANTDQLVDKSVVSNFLSYGQVVVGTQVVPFSGAYSFFLPGSSTVYLSSGTANTYGYALSGSKFTVEAWIYISANTGTYQAILSTVPAANTTGWLLAVINNLTQLNIVFPSSGVNQAFNFAFNTGTWYHIAWTNDTIAHRLYVNGLIIGAYSSSFTWTDQNTLYVGLNGATGALYPFQGYISNVRIVKGYVLYNQPSFSPATSALTASVNTTSLLTAQSASLIDNSGENFLIQNVGTGITGFSNSVIPFANTYSYNFDGTDMLAIQCAQGTSLLDLVDNFTIELWFYANALAGTTTPTSFTLVNRGGGQNIAYSSYMINLYGNQIYFSASSNNLGYDIGGEPLANNIINGVGLLGTYNITTWYHVAVVRNNGIYRGYVNGVNTWTQAGLAPYAATTRCLTIGGSYGGLNYYYNTAFGGTVNSVSQNNQCYFNGYISNLRIANGTAVYTAAFSPPSTALTNAVTTTAYTTLLTAQSATPVDNSPRNNYILGGPVAPTNSVIPFANTYSYPILGTPDYLAASGYMTVFSPGSFSLTSTTTPFTIELWIYPIITPSASQIVTEIYTGGANVINFCIGTTTQGTLGAATGNYLWFGWYGGASWVGVPGTVAPELFKWTHIAGVFDGISASLYVNGILVGNITTAWTGTQADSVIYIGRRWDITTANNHTFTGYISNLRYVKGQALYSANFTPPTTGVTSTIYTQSLINFDNAAIVDSTAKNNLTLYNNPTVSGFSKYGTGSIVFYRTDPASFIQIPNNSLTSLLVFPGDFTFETWVYLNNLPASNSYPDTFYIFQTGTASSPTAGNASSTGLYIGSTNLMFTVTSNLTPEINVAHNMVTNTWYHIAVSRSGSTIRAFVNGILRQTNNGVATGNQLSWSFSGSSQYVLTPATSALEFGSGDFTIEFWWYLTATSRQALYHGSFGTDWSIGIDYSAVSTNQKIGIWASSNGTSWNLINADAGGNGIGTITPTQNAWNHIAYTRSGTTWSLFVNGVRDLNLTGISGSIVSRVSSQKAIGVWFSTGSIPQARGYISNFRIVKGIAVYTGSFVPPTNTLAVTQTGAIATGPFSSTYSYSYNGTNQYLTLADNAAFQFGTGDFTIEWFQLQLSLTGAQCIYDKGYQSAGGISIQAATTTGLISIYSGSATPVFTETGSVSVNTWYHIAVTRQNSTLRFFRNGVQIGSNTSFSTNLTGTVTEAIGAALTSGTGTTPGNYFNGYINNLRIIKGFAFYTSNFTQPSSNLIASTNNSFNFTTSTYGYSFAGTGNYAYTATSANLDPGNTGAWTLEMWVYPQAGNYFYAHGNGAAYGNSLALGWTGSTFVFGQGSGSIGGANPVSYSSAANYPANRWYHVAMSKDSSNNIYMFVNGVLLNTITNMTSTIASGCRAVLNGLSDNNGLGNNGANAILSNIRWVKGTGLYTTTFTPSTTVLTAIANTQFLTAQNPTLVDNSTNAFTFTTVGTATLQSYLVYSSSLLTAQTSAIVDNSTNNFTITNNNAVTSVVYSPAGTIAPIGTGYTQLLTLQTSSLTDASSNNLTLTNNGSLTSSTAFSPYVGSPTATTVSGNAVVIGRANAAGSANTSGGIDGYIDDLRVSKTARYTAGFTPPTGSLPTG